MKKVLIVFGTRPEATKMAPLANAFQTESDLLDTKVCEILDGLYPVVKNPNFSNRQPTPNSYKNLITFVEDRAGHDRRYAIDATKLETQLGWQADENFESGIVKTAMWYLEKYNEQIT